MSLNLAYLTLEHKFTLVSAYNLVDWIIIDYVFVSYIYRYIGRRRKPNSPNSTHHSITLWNLHWKLFYILPRMKYTFSSFLDAYLLNKSLNWIAIWYWHGLRRDMDIGRVISQIKRCLFISQKNLPNYY